jgi:Kdo2-lipid IVA lauroyltransferase/acyltransferase
VAREQSALTNYTQYAALRLVSAGMHIFSPRRNLATASTVGSLLYRFDHRHRQRAIENIARSLPHLPAHEVARIAQASMRHFMQLGVEVMFTTRLVRRDTWADRIRFRGLEKALDWVLSDRPTILVTGHYGNWEVLGYFLATLGIDLAAVARPIDNPLINDWLLGVRENEGLRIITKWGATEPMVELLQRGGTLGFIGDQNAGDKGLFVPFFGRLASAYKSIGLLAIHHNAAVVCGYARRWGDDFGFDVGCTDLILPQDWKDQPDPLYYLTARYTRAIEQMVREAPEQYLWLHRRWKSRPRHERQGRPMPESLERQLRNLPWLDDAALSQLHTPPVEMRD